ncbi:alkaline phosphatase family protein [Metabacillus idriensis]|uniref:alkaline phosphatase family protein n=1 Tax=Metabacillus idriensis TaxID=324768 RepID=UPI0028133552|nr:alkaline phosphatase family protein [Metabacillus idriensis]MDR0137793.1 alkaline phosphatase family protein [Metabacillus idriensis]
MKNRTLVIAALLIILFSGCSANNAQTSPKIIQTKAASSPKVILLVVDSLMDKPLKKAIKQHKAPALEFFLENGQYSKELVSSYPTMSVTIDSTLLTGTNPDKHKIPGLVWYKEDEQRVISYGNGFLETLKYGVMNVADNSLYQFNNKDLSKNVKTIHEELDDRGKQTASINAVIYRGNYQHTLLVPKILSKTTSLPDKYKTNGPKILTLGDFINQDPKNKHVINRLGLNDAFAAQELTYLLKNNLLPEFTILYLPENDHAVHRKGSKTIDGIEKLDKHLQEILNTYPKWDDALENTMWIIMGDGNQSDVKKDKKQALIDLRVALSEYKQLKLGDSAQKNTEIAITANERMAYIYKLNKEISIKKIAYKLQKDPRIAWTAWKENDMVNVISESRKGILQFKPGGSYKDRYHQNWTLKGNMDILDVKADSRKQLIYGNYPDGLARLYGAIYSQKGDFLIADAEPGYEFIGESSPEHTGGGAHGSMHKVDAYAPLIVTGTEQPIGQLRIVDMKRWILDIIDGGNLHD